jgi:hypothetical protein
LNRFFQVRGHTETGCCRKEEGLGHRLQVVGERPVARHVGIRHETQVDLVTAIGRRRRRIGDATNTGRAVSHGMTVLMRTVVCVSGAPPA